MPEYSSYNALGSSVENSELTGSIIDSKLASDYGSVTKTEAEHIYTCDSVATDSGAGTAMDLTAGGSVSYDTTNKKFGSASLLGADAANEHLSHASYLDSQKTNYTNGWTIGFWFRPTNVAEQCGLVGKQNDANNFMYIIFQGPTTDKVEFCYRVAGNNVIVTPNKALTVNTWYYCAMAVGADGDFTGYIVESDSTTTKAEDLATHAAMMTDGTTTSFYIGDIYDLSAPFTGQIDQIEIFDEELTEAQVTALGSRSVVGNTLQSIDTLRSVT